MVADENKAKHLFSVNHNIKLSHYYHHHHHHHLCLFKVVCLIEVSSKFMLEKKNNICIFGKSCYFSSRHFFNCYLAIPRPTLCHT